jgi:hypothetical protein
MLDTILTLGVKLLALVLIPVAFSFFWTGFRLLRGDGLAFKQAKEYHPRAWDAILGKTMTRPSARHGAPLNDGLVLIRRNGVPRWYLNSRMSDEQYDRLTK